MEAITFAAIGAWVWDKYGKSLTDSAGGAVKSKWEKFNWSKAAEKYRDKTKEAIRNDANHGHDRTRSAR